MRPEDLPVALAFASLLLQLAGREIIYLSNRIYMQIKCAHNECGQAGLDYFKPCLAAVQSALVVVNP
jgi:hypothetical protein